MTCVEKGCVCAKSKPARIVYGVALTALVCVAFFHLTNASNDLNQKRNAKLRIFPEPKEGSLIHYKRTEEENAIWKNSFEVFLNAHTGPHPNGAECSWGRAPEGKFCNPKPVDFSPCSSQYNFGIRNDTACIFFSIRPMPDWKPEFYSLEQLPSDLPEILEHRVFREENEDKVAWVTCEGELAADAENIGPIQYAPSLGFNKVQIESDRAVFALYFEKLQVNIVIGVKCQLWTKGNEETLTFQLLVD